MAPIGILRCLFVPVTTTRDVLRMVTFADQQAVPVQSNIVKGIKARLSICEGAAQRAAHVVVLGVVVRQQVGDHFGTGI
ncbi:hypothetical protein DT594_17570 [Halopseudomonas laoshanensis]|uniref:Uncharacterized protein n=2 Tax=Halopseudomonas laoshanensis TaxID=2268758 RepID=A0A7V7GN62_9GAMM|nr:hypothetical protein DT594_17570 [Halopseudomonas laoshanensis]